MGLVKKVIDKTVMESFLKDTAYKETSFYKKETNFYVFNIEMFFAVTVLDYFILYVRTY